MQKETYSTVALIRNLHNFVRPHKGKFILATILRVIGEVVWLYPVYALASITTFFASYQTGDSLTPFWNTMTIFFVVAIVYFVSRYFAFYIGFPLAEKLGIEARFKTIKHMFSLDIEWHEKESTGNKVKRIDRGGDAVHQLVRMWFGPIISIMIGLVGVLIVISTFDWVIALATLVFLIIYFLVSVFFTLKATSAKRKENIKDEELYGIMFESVNNIRSVKVMTMTERLSNNLEKLGGDLYELIRKRVFWFQSGGNIKNLIGQLFRIAMIGFWLGYLARTI